MARFKLLPALGLVALLIAVAVVSFKRRGANGPAAELLPYQTWATELTSVEQEHFGRIRAAVREAESARSEQKKWPSSFGAPGFGWVQRGQGLYINYLGLPSDPARLRWLVLYIEPEPTALKEPAPPDDEEHHTLSDGTALHVSIWSAPNAGPVPDAVLPFPAAENWTQRLGP